MPSLPTTPAAPLASDHNAVTNPPQLLTLGTVIRKDLEASLLSSSASSKSSTDFLAELERDDKPKPFQVNAEVVATGRTCVIGSSGSGKSYTVGVICEELCKARVPFVLIDLEGEYSGLKEKYDAIWVGEEEQCDLKWSNLDLALLAQYAPDCPALILDLSGVDKPRDRVANFLLGVYKEISKRRTPYLVILEEADRFVPQVGERLRIFDELARRGRKRGLGLVFCTQRPSVVDKNILSQCANQLIGKLVIRNDLQSVAQFFSSRGLPNQLTSLAPGEFFALGGLSPDPVCIKIRQRETRHGGMTPKLNPATVHPSLEKVLEALGAPHYSEPLVAEPKEAIADGKEDLEHKEETETEQSGSAETIEQTKAPESRVQILRVGLPPMIDQNQVPLLVKPARSFKVFGDKENVTRVDLVFRPLVEAGITIRAGRLRKKFETQYFYLDGITGRQIEQSDSLYFKEGMGKLLGSSEAQILVLKSLEPDRDQSAVEIASKSGLLEAEQTRRILKDLEDKRVVRGSKLGRAKMYRRLIDIPKIDLLRDSQTQRAVDLAPFESGQGAGSFQENKLDEAKIREIVKGLFDGADLESFKVFYYPIYRVELVAKNGTSRAVLVDARSGRELPIES
jgi:uncharacterized protein